MVTAEVPVQALVPPEIRIRWASADDHAAFREVVRRTRQAAYGALISAEGLAAAAANATPVRRTWLVGGATPIGLLVAVRDDAVVGGAELELLPSGDGELATFYVLPDQQGRGVGIALWEASAQALRERCVAALQVWTMTAATWSRRFYERRGATAFATGAVFIGDEELPHTGYRLALTPAAPDAR
jgi:GNAT superfamily N-acetyltransferase